MQRFDATVGYYCILYEDGDEEELDSGELAAIVVATKTDDVPPAVVSPSPTAGKSTTPQKSDAPTTIDTMLARSPNSRWTTPRRRLCKSEDTLQRPKSLQQQDEMETSSHVTTVDAEDEWKEDDGGVSEAEEEELDWEESITPAKKMKKRRTRSDAECKDVKVKKSPRKRLASGSPRGKKSPKRRGATSSPMSVGDQGLPVGARAIRHGSRYELRSLDGVLPLLTRARLEQAEKQLRLGQTAAASQTLLCPDVGTVRDFIIALRIRWGLENAKTVAPVLSERSQARLEQGTASVDADLPGRLLVVQAEGNAAMEGRVFDSAAALHEELVDTERWATYDLEVVPDSTFGPWRVLLERLEAAGVEEGTQLFLVEARWSQETPVLMGSWGYYKANWSDMPKGSDSMQWALLEGGTRDGPAVVLGASSSLLTAAPQTKLEGPEPQANTTSAVPVVPPLANSDVRLQSSQLQKSIRRGFCSAAPLLEACRSLVSHWCRCRLE